MLNLESLKRKFMSRMCSDQKLRTKAHKLLFQNLKKKIDLNLFWMNTTLLTKPSKYRKYTVKVLSGTLTDLVQNPKSIWKNNKAIKIC